MRDRPVPKDSAHIALRGSVMASALTGWINWHSLLPKDDDCLDKQQNCIEIHTSAVFTMAFA